MEDVKVRKFGPTCGKHGSSTFFKAFKYKKDGKSKIISLGQFFFMKILDSIPICIAELQLVWEEKHSSSDLASVRLYFLPECTPDGRQPNHGEDEVLAYYEKIVLKLSDLASLIVHDVSWSEGRAAFMGLDYPMQPGHKELAEAFGMNKGKQPIDSDCSPDIIVMTYSRYCRYRCMLKRLEGCEDKWLKNALVCAIGGFAAQKENNRVYFCKDIFEHADLDDFELRCDHLAPNLKGRPRGRRKSSVRREGGGESEEENSSCSSSFSSNMDTANKIRTGSRATPLRNGFRIDKIKVSKDEQAFLIDLHQFMKRRNTAIGRIPSLGFKQKGRTLAPVKRKKLKPDILAGAHRYDIMGDNSRMEKKALGRKPFTAQKTVRELLHQNGIEPKDTNTSRLDMEHKENKLRASNNVPERRILESNTSNIGVKSEPSSGVANNVFSTSSSFQSDIKPLPATLLPVPNQARPMFYPQILPVGGAMSPMGMPFMIPSFNYQPISASIQSLPANVRNPVSIKEEQPLTALNKMAASASHNSSVSSGKSAMSNTVSRPMISPPSAHTFSVKTSSSALSPFPQRPITPAHTNNNKRQYPPSDSNKNFSHPMGNSSSVLGHESDVKRQKLHGSQSNIYSSPSSSGNLDAPVLDLSMKTMKAQEAKHHRGESLLFDASFTREGNFIPKSEPYDAPQDLSKKSQFNPMENVGERNLSCHKNVPLNVPHPHSMPYIKKEEPSPVNPETSESMTPQIGSKLFPGMTSMAGLPMDPSAMFHPAFPQQMLMGGLGLPGMSGGIPGMGGLFPTPLQLQQMIQGQVAGMGGFPFLRPDFLQGPVMFPGMNPGMFTSVAPSVIKSNPSGSTAGKR
ncbi:ARI5B-like protein [Mya arenaria]|uniref:ARI5B-like protein n=1 Tax=Mya arenaria TaxID=6604 RepID=A0ABY7FM52_MYAAR|nr:ARI5B-like protein [Mya arenaria]